jgi:hypothetical protein
MYVSRRNNEALALGCAQATPPKMGRISVHVGLFTLQGYLSPPDLILKATPRVGELALQMKTKLETHSNSDRTISLFGVATEISMESNMPWPEWSMRMS